MKKKEKNEKLSTEEEMVKSYKTCNGLITFLEALVILGIIGGILTFINLCIKCKFDVVKIRDTFLADIGFYDDNGFASDYYQGLPEYIDNNEMTDDDKAYIEPGNIYKCFYIIGFLLRIASLFIMINSLRKILSDSINQKTPFVEKNIKRMKVIAISSVLYSRRLIYCIIIVMVNVLYKYGCKLQKESDELL